MSSSGHLLLCNNTPDSWSLIGSSSSQMPTWSFPQTIGSKSCPYIFVQFQTDNGGNDQGDAEYISDSGHQFTVQARGDGGFHLQIEQLNFGDDGTTNLGWQPDGYVGFAFGPDYTGSPAGF